VDVVVPFRGGLADLEELRARLERLQLRSGDSLVLVDNTPWRPAPDFSRDGVPVVHAAQQETPGYARNQGAKLGNADWLVFLDADVVAPPDLLDRYFDPPPGKETALIAGGVLDEEVPPKAPPAARYAHIRGLMSQDNTYRFGKWSFPQTANAACRREAFEAVGGFREDIRAAEDADLTYRLQGEGWRVERREEAPVVHLSRQTVRALVGQKLLHGAGAAWLSRRYPGAFPGGGHPVLWGAYRFTTGLLEATRKRDRDRALWAVFEPLEYLTYVAGRILPNQRPIPERSLWSRLIRLRRKGQS
jgi:mycofactocin glycosyltransferase